MSSLKRSVGVRDLWRRLAKFLTYKKLSWMLLVFMKALWALETSLFMCGASLVAIILVISLAIAWMRLMGLKSVTSSAPSFLGMRAIFAEFSQWRLLVWRAPNWLITAMISILIMFQQDLKKAPVKPSGPGALSLAVLLIASLTSSSVKAASNSLRSHWGRGMDSNWSRWCVAAPFW